MKLLCFLLHKLFECAIYNKYTIRAICVSVNACFNFFACSITSNLDRQLYCTNVFNIT